MHSRHIMNGTVALLPVHDPGGSTLPGLKQGGNLSIEQVRGCRIEGANMPEFLLALIVQGFELNSNEVSMVMNNGAPDSEHGFVACKQKFYIAYLSGAGADMKQPRLKQCAGPGNVNQLAAVSHELQT